MNLNIIESENIVNLTIQEYNEVPEFVINSASLISNNIISITLSEGGYNSSLGGISKDAFTFTYTSNSDTLISCELLELSDVSGNLLVGGEKVIYAHLYLEGQSDGNGTVKMQVICDNIYNAAGVSMRSTQMTSEFTLTAETIDFIPNLQDVALYMDANDPATIDETTDFIWTDKSNNRFEFKQSNAGLKPTNDIATNQAIDFTARGQYLQSDKPVWLDDINGFSIFFIIDYQGGDQIVSDIFSYLGVAYHGIDYILIRSSSVYFAIHGSTSAIFTTTTPYGYKIIEFRYTGTQYELYVDNILAGTPVTHSSIDILYLNRIGSGNVGQGINTKLRNITVFNSTDATIRTAIYNKLKTKFIDQTELSNVSRTNYLKPINLVAVWGDSNGVGRDTTANLSASYQYIEGNQQGYIGAPKTTGINPNTQVSIPYNANIQYGDETYANNFGTEAPIMYWGLQDNKYYAISKYAIGSTAFEQLGSADWNKSELHSYQNAFRVLLFTMQTLKSKMFNIDIKGIMMFIGSNDSSNTTATANFITNIRQFKIDVRADLGISDLKFMTFNTIFSEPGKDTVNTALATASAEDSNHLNSDISESMPLKADEHFTADALVQLGKYAYDNFFKI